jgi:pyruvate dehydrogenase E2 component (dihydrolipoamide acetyltransferase)
VRAGDPIFTLDGDKALQDIEATGSGILRIPPDTPKPGSTVRVGDLLGYLLAQDEELPSNLPDAPPPPFATTPSVSEELVARPAPPPEPEPERPPRSSGAIAISPRALRAAEELGVDWSKVRGTGRTGRIRERDVLAAARSSP